MFAVAAIAEKGPNEKSEIHLSKPVRRLLSAEMNRIQNGMTNLAIAIPAGKWGEIAQTSEKMSEGYIMKQKLSKEQMKEFNESLPDGYKVINDEFHKTAGQLIHAAKEHNGRLVNSYFLKLNETCIKCHAKYAKKRFPGFKRMKLEEE
jgi:hypothetical protein